MVEFINGFINKLFSKKSEQRYCCKDCLCRLNSVLDGEATNEEIIYLQEHIEKCAPCYNHYHIEKSVKEVIKYKLEQKPVPSHLIEKIRVNIHKNY